MTDAQTEARALLETAGARFPDYEEYDAAVAVIATALAAKDAELAQVIKTGFERCADITARAEAAEAQLAEARKALEPFARIADDYTDEEDDDFQVWKDFDVLGATLPLKHFRAARRAREAQGGER